MRTITTSKAVALTVAALAIAAPAAQAEPDGYQPQLQTGSLGERPVNNPDRPSLRTEITPPIRQPDAAERNRVDEGPDALGRWLLNNSSPARPAVAEARPVVSTPASGAAAASGIQWLEAGVGMAAGFALALVLRTAVGRPARRRLGQLHA